MGISQGGKERVPRKRRTKSAKKGRNCLAYHQLTPRFSAPSPFRLISPPLFSDFSNFPRPRDDGSTARSMRVSTYAALITSRPIRVRTCVLACLRARASQTETGHSRESHDPVADNAMPFSTEREPVSFVLFRHDQSSTRFSRDSSRFIFVVTSRAKEECLPFARELFLPRFAHLPPSIRHRIFQRRLTSATRYISRYRVQSLSSSTRDALRFKYRVIRSVG